MPIDASPLPCAVRAVSRTLVINWNRLDLPLEEKPISAALSMANRESYITTPELRCRTMVGGGCRSASCPPQHEGDEPRKLLKRLVP